MIYSRLIPVVLASLCLSFTLASFEYEAVYHIQHSDETHTLNLAKKENGETSLKFVFVKTDEGTLHGIEEKEDIADTASDANSPTTLTASSAAESLDTDNSAKEYKADLDANSWLTVFNVDFPSDGYYALYAEHDLSKFQINDETTVAFLMDAEGHAIEPSYYVGQPHTDDKSSSDGWRDTMLGCLIVWAVTLSGVVILAIQVDSYNAIKDYVVMFASGTLLSTAFALVLFDAVELINNPSNEGLAAGRWTAMIMTGFLTTPVLRLVMATVAPQYMTLSEDKEVELSATKDVQEIVIAEEGSEQEEPVDGVEVKKTAMFEESNLAIFLPMILGDFFHNFADGIFIGAAFKCNASFAWKIVGITVGHEIPQEISDFVILTTKLNYSTLEAFAYNALSGASVMLGGVTIMASNTSDLAVGMLLAYGAGNYVYLATVHLFEDVGARDIGKQLMKLLTFCIGVVAIGLILLDHEHCESTTSSSSGGDGHGHS